jgi:hypothetical protein
MDCSDTTGYAPIFVAIAVVAIILMGCVVVSCYSKKAEEGDRKGGAAKGIASCLAGEAQGEAQGSIDGGGAMVANAGTDHKISPMVMSKILIGLTQMLSELPGALALSFPAAFTAVLKAMKIFLGDIFEIFRVDCVQPLSLYAKFSIIMMLPFAGTCIVQLLRCFADYRAGGDTTRIAENKANSEYRMFFVIFLLYPLLSRTAFHIYSCQTLGVDEQWHMDDMTIDCASRTHSAFMVIGVICIVAYPIGIPLTFFFLLRQDHHSCSLCAAIFHRKPEPVETNKNSNVVYPNDGEVEVQGLTDITPADEQLATKAASGGPTKGAGYTEETEETKTLRAKLSAHSYMALRRRAVAAGASSGELANADDADEPKTALVGLTTALETKETASSKFDFLKKDYKLDYYYFECVTLFEKLLLTGLLAFIDQGSIFQCFVGACIACTFLTVQLKFWPYANHTDNVLKAVAEGQLFLTLLLSIVLRSEALHNSSPFLVSSSSFKSALTWDGAKPLCQVLRR